MTWLTTAYDWFMSGNGLLIVAALLAISEALTLVKGVEANGVFQAIVNGLRWLKDRLKKE